MIPLIYNFNEKQTCKYCSEDFFDIGLTLRHGQSVCAVSIENPAVLGLYDPPIANAKIDDSSLLRFCRNKMHRI